MPNLFISQDPRELVTPKEDDPLYKVLLKRAAGALGLGDPNNQAMGMMSPLAMAAKSGGKTLMPLIVNVWKQRLKADPSLAYNPGAHQVPEFQAAFKELFPYKKFVQSNAPIKSVSSTLQAAPPPPSGSLLIGGVDDIIEAAKTAPSAPKPPKTMTWREWRLSQGKTLAGQHKKKPK